MNEGPTPPCERFKADLSAFADDTLPVRRWQQVGYHVAGCQGCRDELADIRRVQRTLQAPGQARDSAPQNLAARLQKIAGEHVDSPLYMAAGPHCALPSKRRVRTRRLMQSSLAAMTVVASVLVLALWVSPAPPVISNGVTQARDQYALSTTAINLNESVGAVLLAHERGAAFGKSYPQSPRSTMTTSPQRITASSAAQKLAGESSTHSGIQRVWLSAEDGGYHVTDVRVDEVAGEGTSLVVLDSTGSRFLSWFVPTVTCCEFEGGPPWTFYQYSGIDQIAGRWTNVIEARDEDGQRVARWWVDCDDSLIVWFEHYDGDGVPTIMSGFTSLSMGEAELADGEVERAQMSSLTSSGTKGWCLGLETCPARLAGLPLIAHSSSSVQGSRSMSLFYSDGFQGLSVVWEEGQLEGETYIFDDTAGFPEVAVWQASDGVVSVATNVSQELLEQARGELPDEEEWHPSLMERVRSGLALMAGIN